MYNYHLIWTEVAFVFLLPIVCFMISIKTCNYDVLKIQLDNETLTCEYQSCVRERFEQIVFVDVNVFCTVDKPSNHKNGQTDQQVCSMCVVSSLSNFIWLCFSRGLADMMLAMEINRKYNRKLRRKFREDGSERFFANLKRI